MLIHSHGCGGLTETVVVLLVRTQNRILNGLKPKKKVKLSLLINFFYFISFSYLVNFLENDPLPPSSPLDSTQVVKVMRFKKTKGKNIGKMDLKN
jgi:hypothetical protein